jgi:hypothetical protein
MQKKNMLSRKKIEKDILTLSSNRIISKSIQSSMYALMLLDVFLKNNDPLVLNKFTENIILFSILNLTVKEKKKMVTDEFIEKLKQNNLYTEKVKEALLSTYSVAHYIETKTTIDSFKKTENKINTELFMQYKNTSSKDELIKEIKNGYSCYYLQLVADNSDIFKDKETILSAIKECDSLNKLLTNNSFWSVLIGMDLLKEAIEIFDKKITHRRLNCEQLNNYIVIKFFNKDFVNNNYSFELKNISEETKKGIEAILSKYNQDCLRKNKDANSYSFIYDASLIYPYRRNVPLKRVIIELIEKNDIDNLIKIYDYQNLIKDIVFNDEPFFREIKELLEKNKSLIKLDNTYYFYGMPVYN